MLPLISSRPCSERFNRAKRTKPCHAADNARRHGLLYRTRGTDRYGERRRRRRRFENAAEVVGARTAVRIIHDDITRADGVRTSAVASRADNKINIISLWADAAAARGSSARDFRAYVVCAHIGGAEQLLISAAAAAADRAHPPPPPHLPRYAPLTFFLLLPHSPHPVLGAVPFVRRSLPFCQNGRSHDASFAPVGPVGLQRRPLTCAP